MTTPLLGAPNLNPISPTTQHPASSSSSSSSLLPLQAKLDPEARRKQLLGFWDGVSLTLGIQIGSGIFISPALVARNTTGVVPALTVWTIGGFLAWACAACYIEIGTRLPVNGGPQEYLAHCFGDLFGFLASWGCIFAVKPCSAAILALFIADYICGAVAVVGPHGAGTGAELPVLHRNLVAIAVVAVVTAVNCTGNQLSKVSTKVLLVCKTIGVGFVIIMGFAVLLFPRLWPPPGAETPVTPPPEQSAGSYGTALVAAMWAYSGWEVVRVRTPEFPGD